MKKVEIFPQSCLINYYNNFLKTNILIPLYMEQEKFKNLSSRKNNTDRYASIHELSDTKIMDLIYRDFSNFIYTIVKNKIKSSQLSVTDIDDCFIEVILKISEKKCKRIRSFRGESSFKTYLTVLCRNLITDFIRREERISNRMVLVENLEFEEELLPTGNGKNDCNSDNPENQFLAKEKDDAMEEALKLLEGALKKLLPEEQLLIKLKMKKNLSYREIDEFLDIDNSRYRITRIIHKIRNTFDANTKQFMEELFEGEG